MNWAGTFKPLRPPAIELPQEGIEDTTKSERQEVSI